MKKYDRVTAQRLGIWFEDHVERRLARHSAVLNVMEFGNRANLQSRKPDFSIELRNGVEILADVKFDGWGDGNVIIGCEHATAYQEWARKCGYHGAYIITGHSESDHLYMFNLADVQSLARGGIEPFHDGRGWAVWYEMPRLLLDNVIKDIKR